MRGPFLFLLLFLSIYFPSDGRTAEGSSPEAVSLTLREAIHLAIENNPDIQIERRNAGIRETEILFERAQFDPEINLTSRENRSFRATSSFLEAGIGSGLVGVTKTDQATIDANLGLKQRLYTGGEYDLQFTNRFLDTPVQLINPSIRSDLFFTVTQPLLRGFGPAISQTQIRIARNNLVLSQQEFRKEVMDLVSEVEEAYWNLVLAREKLTVAQQALTSAQTLLEGNTLKVKAGVLAGIEILVAEAGAASREEQVLVAHQAVKDAEDRLRRLIALPGRSLVEEAPLIPVDTPVPVGREEITVERAVHIALKKRPEITQAAIDLKSNDLSLQLARNRLLPSLDLRGSVGIDGLGGDSPEAFDSLTSGDFRSWEVGMTLSIPLGNRSARSIFMKTQLEREKLLLAQKSREQRITIEVKEAIRRVETDRKRINSTKKARLLTEQKLTAQRERFSLGLVSSHDLLQFQDDLAEAKGKELAAITDYLKSQAFLEKAMGTILDIHNIIFAEE